MTCQICFEEHELIKGPYKCNIDHFFCEDCINKWENKPCPICRSEPINNINFDNSLNELPIIIHYSNAGLLTGWNALNRMNNLNRINTNPRPRRSRRQVLSLLSSLDTFDSDDIEIVYNTFERERNSNNRPRTRRNAIVSTSPLIDISTSTNSIITNINSNTELENYYRQERMNRTVYEEQFENLNETINHDDYQNFFYRTLVNICNLFNLNYLYRD